MRIASLPMYDLVELKSATDALWAAVADRLLARGIPDVPRTLTRVEEFGSEWLEPQLLLSQTCGYVATHALANKVKLVATPCYRVPGCSGARYRSYLVVGKNSRFRELTELRGSIAVYNTDDSHSGMNALRCMIAPLAQSGKFFARTECTGAHRLAVERIAAGTADVAAIDCVTFALLERVAPSLTAAVRVIGESPLVPALPLITRRDATEAELDAAVVPAVAPGSAVGAGSR